MLKLQGNLLFCFSGIARNSSEVQAGHTQRRSALHTERAEMKSLVEEAQKVLNGNVDDFDDFGRLLDLSWEIKRSFSSKVSNDTLDQLYECAKKAGALGGKVCGAGGGGFMVFYVPSHRRAAVENALKHTLIVPIHFESIGSHAIFFSHENAFV